MLLSKSSWKPRDTNKVKWTTEECEELPVIIQPSLMFADLVMLRSHPTHPSHCTL